MTHSKVLIFLSICACMHLSLGRLDVGVIYSYFEYMKVDSMVQCLCSTRDDFLLRKSFNKIGKTVVSIDLKRNSEREIDFIFKTNDRIGIIVDGTCKENLRILKYASRTKNFHMRRIWLVFWNEPLVLADIREAAEQAKPPFFDVEQFFLDEYDGMRERERMEIINAEVNAQLLADIVKEQAEEKAKVRRNVTIPKEAQDLVNIEAMVESEVTLAIPKSAKSPSKWDLWNINRKTNFSSLEIIEAGEIVTGEKLDLSFFDTLTSLRRNDFHKAVMRTGCCIEFFDYFNRSDELTTTKVVDVWSQMTFTHMKLIEEMLNLRMLVKCFPDYGWPSSNGSFNGVVGFLQRNKAEMTATGFVLHGERLNVVDYVDGTFEFLLGILFRQPPLSQVTNIFVLPFSYEVWIALVALLAVAGGVFYTQLRVRLSEDHGTHEHIGDVVSLLSGAMCQQGFYMVDRTVSVRVSMVVVLISTIFFFTSYTATIVALLQTPSHLINSLETFVDSPLEIAIEDLAYEKKFLQEDSHEIVEELIRKKIAPKGDDAYLHITIGIEKVRKGLFAFQCELANAYKRIEETYTEGEKCGLEKLDLFPNKILGPGLTKKSPYREILAGRMRWLREVGITSRTLSRWFHKKPGCESRSTGFSSVGIIDITPLILILFYGVCAALVVLCLEFLLHANGTVRRLARRGKMQKKMQKLTNVQLAFPKYPVKQFTH